MKKSKKAAKEIFFKNILCRTNDTLAAKHGAGHSGCGGDCALIRNDGVIAKVAVLSERCLGFLVLESAGVRVSGVASEIRFRSERRNPSMDYILAAITNTKAR
jgi:hypothetical protein